MQETVSKEKEKKVFVTKFSCQIELDSTAVLADWAIVTILAIFFKHFGKKVAPTVVERSKSSDENQGGEEEAWDQFSAKPTFFLISVSTRLWGKITRKVIIVNDITTSQT